VLKRAYLDGGPEKEAVAKFLIGRGADLNARDKNGETILMLAWGEEEARFLVENGADPGIRKDNGDTALSIAKKQ
jgi:ankyrin repeat protein